MELDINRNYLVKEYDDDYVIGVLMAGQQQFPRFKRMLQSHFDGQLQSVGYSNTFECHEVNIKFQGEDLLYHVICEPINIY